jgi:glycosyltransferase involved in cell wall biosynthesis
VGGDDGFVSLRILYVVHAYVPEKVGGVELHCHYLASALAKDHTVAVLTWCPDPEKDEYAVEECRQGDVTVWRLNHRFTDVTSFQGTYRNERIDTIFAGILESWRPDIVHVQHLIGLSTGILEYTKGRALPLVLGLHDFWFGCPRGQRIRDPLVVCHDIDRRLCVPCLKPENYELRAPRRPFWEWLRRLRLPTSRRGLRILAQYDADMRRALALPDALITPSNFHKDMYSRRGVDTDKVRVIPYGLPTAAITAAERHPNTHLRIGFLGTLIPSKGAHVLLEAYRLLARPDVALDFYGVWVPFHGDAGYLDRLKAAASTIPGSIEFHGRYEQDDVPRILSSLDVLVVPSVWYESYSIVIREGFLAGVPVVASNLGAMAEAIQHEVNGLVFSPGDAADLAVQLRRLLEEPELRRAVAAHPKKVSSIEENAARHQELYGQLLSGAGRCGSGVESPISGPLDPS